MPKYDFFPLYEKYPAVIAQMDDIFNSRQFIQRLAQQNQTEYIEALYSYRNATHRGESTTPFMIVHSILAKHLKSLPEHAEYIGDTLSKDIFGRPNECAQWRKLQLTRTAKLAGA